ncbi:alanine--tRNA ligase [Endozoicomonadaceae bacterium StTr2]
MKTNEIRSAFLEYFRENGHEVVASSSLVPHDDPTLLFINAGMNQFKDLFLGREKRDYTRATTAQKCVRAGGKHNDLDNVGYTARHHTFFEMLGNFSFGDYFKKEAIHHAWSFLTETLKLPKERLCVTVYESDDEAYNIWLNEIGVPAEDIIRIGDNKGAPYASDNFWQMGDTGPCGPCTEIFFDHGDHIWGGRPGTPEEDGDRFIEIWNIVFMQYNRHADGKMDPLPKPSVDTGMGLERIAAVMQHVNSNYEIDLFQSLLNDASKLLGGVATTEGSLRVIADHIRSCSFLISDGVMPSNEGRGYTLRRIIRRACRHGHKLGAEGAFFHKLVAALVKVMGEAYPDLVKNQAQVERTLLKEEEQFTRTLDKGMKLLEESIAKMEGDVISGDTVFTLYDTYGFPVDLTEDIAREHQLTVNKDGFEKALEAQRERARASSKFGLDYNDQLDIKGETEFTGYTELEGDNTIGALFAEGQPVEQAEAGQKATIVLSATPFYAESGGQVGDTGMLVTRSGKFRVLDTTKQGANHLHAGEVIEGSIRVDDNVRATVDAEQRAATALNHSATHLLHEALRRVLGEHVQQKGSLVNPERLRFDFSHFEAVKPEELREVERMVNNQIRANTAVETEVTDMDTARAKGAMALFGEKYGDTVRLLSMGTDSFSVELCGGTHVERTGDIGQLKIVSESGIASGVRRIEAITGEAAELWQEQNDDRLQAVAGMVKASRDNVESKVRAALERNRQLEKELQQLKQQLAAAAGADMASQAKEVSGIKLLATIQEGADPKSLRDTVDQLKNKLGSGVVMLAAVNGDKIALAAGVTQDLTKSIKAGDLLKMVATRVGGKGGGRPDFAQGGGSDAAALPAAMESVESWVAEQL